jgi:hypothetical protein
MRTLLCLLSLGLGLASIGVHAESAAGVKWTAPAGWTSQAPRPMRAATYAIGPTSGDKTGAECAVYFFGPGQGGSVDANVTRWKSQFTGPGGAPAAANVATRKVRGLAMTTIDVAGDYSGIGGPTATAPQTVAGYRLLGAIIEGPGGNVFIKFTGPVKTIAANQQKFEQLLASFQPEK